MQLLNASLSRNDESNKQCVNLHIERTNGAPLLTHRIGADQRPYIHPIMAPDSAGILTEDAPAHHPWQHGLYTGFNLVNGVNFWKDQEGEGTFKSSLSDAPNLEADRAQWNVRADWNAPNGATLIAERQSWSLTDHGATFELDLHWELHVDHDVEIGQYMAGGLFLRMPYAEQRGALAINSEGQRNGDAETRRARWVAVSMPIVGRADWAGMAMMDHPSNPEHPVTWRVDSEFGISPSRCIGGSWRIPAGGVDHYRYRILVFGGAIDTGVVEASWRAFVAE